MHPHAKCFRVIEDNYVMCAFMVSTIPVTIGKYMHLRKFTNRTKATTVSCGYRPEGGDYVVSN